MSSSRAPARFQVAGHAIRCPTCAHDRFHTRRSVLNTRGATFFGFDWANRGVLNLICADCSRIQSFQDESRVIALGA